MSGKGPSESATVESPKGKNIPFIALGKDQRHLWHAIQILSDYLQKEEYAAIHPEIKIKFDLLVTEYGKYEEQNKTEYGGRPQINFSNYESNTEPRDLAKKTLKPIILKAKAIEKKALFLALVKEAYASIKDTESDEMEENAIRRAAVNAERKGIEEAALTRKLEGWNEIIRTAEANLLRIPPNSPSRAPLTRKLKRAQAIVASIEDAKRHLSTTLTDGSPQQIRAAGETLEKAYIAANSARATINGNYNDGENYEFHVEPNKNMKFKLIPASNFVIPSAHPSVYSGPEPTWPSNPGDTDNSNIEIEEEEETAEGGRRRNVKRRRTVRRARKGRRFNRTRK